jgi:hypothetical protein
MSATTPLLQKIDAVTVPVPDLDACPFTGKWLTPCFPGADAAVG